MTVPPFFRIEMDPKVADHRWQLGRPRSLSGEDVDPRVFTQGRHTDHTSPLLLEYTSGDRYALNFAAFDMVVNAKSLNDKLENLTGSELVQRIPVLLDYGAFEVLNVCDRVQCVDLEQSSFTRWTDADGRSDRVGQLRMVLELRIRPEAASGHHLFRVNEWPVALIVSAEGREVIENHGSAGVSFLPV